MPTRRPLLKRVALWTGAVVLLLASYVLGAPFVDFAATRYAPPFVEPVLKAVYAPIIFLDRNPEAPGHHAFQAYLTWCQEKLRRIP